MRDFSLFVAQQLPAPSSQGAVHGTRLGFCLFVGRWLASSLARFTLCNGSLGCLPRPLSPAFLLACWPSLNFGLGALTSACAPSSLASSRPSHLIASHLTSSHRIASHPSITPNHHHPTHIFASLRVPKHIIRPSIFSSIHPSIHPFIHPSIRPSVHPPFSPSLTLAYCFYRLEPSRCHDRHY